MSGMLILDIVLLTLLVITAVATVEVRSLYSAVMMGSIYSLLMACFWMTMDAVDVAYTEAAVGAGISTILLIGTLVLTGSQETIRRTFSPAALAACLLCGGLLVYGTLDMPAFGDAAAPAHTHRIYDGFTQQDVAKDPKGGGEPARPGENFFHGHVPNQVTSIIVSYRAYDTLFETAVILTAGIALILLLRGRKGNPQRGGLL